MWSNYSDSEKGVFIYSHFKKKARYIGDYFIIHVDLCASWSENWRTDSFAAAADTTYCERRAHVCIVSLGLSASRRVAVKCDVLSWRGGLQSGRLCGSVFLYFHIQIWLCSLSYLEFRGLLHAYIPIANWFARAWSVLTVTWRPNSHQICCHPSFRLNLICWKRRWNSAVFAFACYFWVIHLTTLSFPGINTLFVFTKGCLNWSFSAGFRSLSGF